MKKTKRKDKDKKKKISQSFVEFVQKHKERRIRKKINKEFDLEIGQPLT